MSREDVHEGEDVLVDYEADDDEDSDENENVNVDLSTEVEAPDKSHGVDGVPDSRVDQTESENRKRKHQSDEVGIQKAADAEVSLGVGEPTKRNKTANDNGRDLAKTRVEMEVGRSASGSGPNSISYNHGVYIPPFRRRQLEKLAVSERGEINAQSHSGANANVNAIDNTDSTAVAAVLPMKIQRQKWEELKKAINGTINRLNSKTIKDLIHSLFQNANLIRGKGLMAKSILRAATTSPTYCPVYASLIAVVNTKLPEVGELIVTRAILMFRKSYARQDRAITMATANFMGCLFNQGLCHELLCLQILTVLLEGDPTDDSVEVAVQFTKVVGMALNESSPTGIHAIMERFRNLLHDGRIGRRVQYKIEELMKIRKNRFKEFPALEEDLDLVESEEQITFELGLDDEGLEKEEHLDVFRFDPNWSENENDWIEIRREILGDDSDDSDDSDTEEESEEEDDSDEDDEDGVLVAPEEPSAYSANDKQITEIRDMSETDLINLRRTIYLTIMSSATFEECSHKLSKMDIPIGKEMELINMLIECCSQERTFLRYYGLIAARFCLLHRRWSEAFHEAFIAQYNTIHRLETNKLRNVAKLFSHLLHTDSLSWSCLAAIHLNEDETTSSSRIFLKILIQEMAEAIGIGTLVKRFESDDPETMEWFKEIFPKDNPRKTRYAINFFTSIGLGPLTDGLREYLKNAPKIIMQQAREEAARLKALENENGSDSDTSSVVSSSSSSVSSSSVSSSSYTSSSSGSYSSSSTYTSSDESSYSKRRKGRGRGRSRKSRSKGGSSRRSRRSRSRGRGRGRSTSSSSYSDRNSISPSPSRTSKRSQSKRKEPKRSSRSRSRSMSRSRSRSRGDIRSGKGKGRDERSRSPSLDSLGRARKRSSKTGGGDRTNSKRDKSISRSRSRSESRSRSRSASPSPSSRYQGGRSDGRGGKSEKDKVSKSKSSRRRRSSSRSISKSISPSPESESESDKSTNGKGNGGRRSGGGGRDKRSVDRSRSYSRSTSRSRR